MRVIIALKFGLVHGFEKYGVAHDERIFNTPLL
jgi:hypothetical protein